MPGSPNYEQQQRAKQQKPWQPFGEVGKLTDKLKSETATEARQLHAAWQKAQAEVSRLEGEQQASIADLEAAKAKAKDTRSIVAEAKSRKISEREIMAERDADVQVKERVANPERWRGFIGPGIEKRSGLLGEADAEAEGAKSALENFLTRHADELDKELAADARRVHKAINELRKQLEPLEREHDELTSTLGELYGRTEGVSPEHIPSGKYEQKPALAAEARQASEPQAESKGYSPIVKTPDTALGQSPALREHEMVGV